MEGLKDPQMQRFIAAESQRQQFQAAIHMLTEECWDKCVTDRPGQRLGGGTESCIHNCVERFVDVANFVANRIQSQSMTKTDDEGFSFE